jgi:cyanophycin synthetase
MLHLQQEKLIQAARQAGITTEDLSISWGQDAVRYSLGTTSEVVFEGNAFGSTPLLATTICNDLPIARHFLGQLGIPSPKGKVFKLEGTTTSKAQLEALIGEFWQAGTSYVCRPAYDNTGHGIAGNITALTDLELHLDSYASDYATWILEEQVVGDDLQLLVVGGELVSGILRSPLKLQGDGIKTLEEMIDQHNASASDAQRVEINGETRQLLRDQSVFLSEPVPAGQWVQLKQPSAGAGGATDVTTRLHASYAEWARKIARSVGLGLFSMNCRTTDPAADPQAATWVLDLNARPEWIAFDTADGNARDIAKLLLQAAFGLGK